MVSITTEYSVAKPILHKLKFIAQSVLEHEGITESEVSVLLTDDTKMTQLNQQYFRKNYTTDVISFPQNERNVLGDVAVSVETAEKQAITFGHHLEDELVYLIIHGILHLLGFDDLKIQSRRKMRVKERAYLAQFQIEAHPEKR